MLVTRVLWEAFLRTIAILILAVSFALPAFPQQASSDKQSNEPVLPYIPSLDPAYMDKSVDACQDFYTYSCGGWMKNNPIPSDQTSWSVYGKLYEDNLKYLRGILQEDEHAKQRDAIAQKIGDFYGACMDEAKVNADGTKPIASELKEVAAMNNSKQIAPLLANLHLDGVRALFGSASMQDPDNSESMIVGMEQGGLGLPDRDYYLTDDDKSKQDRAKYLEHVAKIFELLGDAPAQAKSNAETVMKIETELAKNSLTQVERRDPYKIKNKLTPAELAAMAPNFDWNAYFATAKVPHFDVLNLNSKVFFKNVSDQVGSVPLADWQTYLRFHIANSRSQFLSKPFAAEYFEFYRKYLRGATEDEPRWKKCVGWTD